MTYVYFNTSVAAVYNDISDNTSVAVTGNSFVEVWNTGRKVALIVFYIDLSKKSILLGASKVDMDLPSSTSVSH